MKLALNGGTPVRRAFPAPSPRLSRQEAKELLRTLAGAAEWSRAADHWPLPVVDQLEADWAREHQARQAVAVTSGTAALTLILRALGLSPGDEVLIPAYGCPAVDVAVLAAGLTPVHVDIDARTYGISPPGAAAAVTPRTTAMIAVHFAGAPADMPALARVADRQGLALIEDACLAPGAGIQSRPVGSWSRAAAFSLGVRKPITSGEGGVVTTNDERLGAALRCLRSLGANPETGEILEPSGNYRLTALQAAVALPQLARLEADRLLREEAAAVIEGALPPGGPFQPLEQHPQTSRHARAQLWIRYDDSSNGVPRERAARALQAEGIPVFEGWDRPNHCLAMYTPARAAEWLLARGADRMADAYERAHCPAAERAAFGEALVMDLPVLQAEPGVAHQAAEAISKVIQLMLTLR